MKQRIGVLDSFRGLAAISVVYYHFTYWFRQIHGHTFPEYLDYPFGSYSVFFFFIISGFVIFMTVERCKSPVEFAYRRFIRLYPTYWICLIISAVILYYFGIPAVKPTLNQFAINLTMLQRIMRSDDIDPSYWSLLPELAFYFLIFSVFILKLLNRIYLWGAIWIFCSVINGYFDFHRLELFFEFSGLFFSGVLFYKMFNGDKRLVHHFSILVCYITIVLNLDDKAISNVSHLLPVGVVYILFYLFLFNKLNFLDNKPLRFLGYISYPLYLIHQGIGFTILLHLRSYGYTGYWVIIIPTLVSVLLAYVIARYCEKPIIKFAKENIESRFFLKEERVVLNK